MSRRAQASVRSAGAGRTDWDAVKDRLLAARSLAEAVVPTPSEVDALLASRARRLAAPTERAEPAGERGDYLEVTVVDGRFAVASPFVRGVFPSPPVMPLPGTPEFVLGLVHLRGEILSVLDPRALLGLPGERSDETGFIVVLEGVHMRLGMMVDDVAAVCQLRADAIRPAPAGSGWHRGHVAGIAPGGIVVLDANRLLSDDALVVRQDAEPLLTRAEP